MAARLLVVDDEPTLRETLAALLRAEGHTVSIASDVGSALERIDEAPFDVVLTDLNMPSREGLPRETAGMELLRHVVERCPGTPVIVITGHGSIASAVDAMRGGAADYVTKPFRREEIATKVEAAVERVRLRRALAERIERDPPEALVARSPAMRPLLERLSRCAVSDTPVLVCGPPGSGKERVARALHASAGLPADRFVAVRCGALPEALYEAELFGHEKGAFTGASRMRRGLIEEASGGTLFFDCIEESSLALQARLLPVLQTRQTRRIGGSRQVSVNARIVASCAVDLRERVREERFRSDLFYVLRVVVLDVPPLRERREDVPELARRLLEEAAHAQRRNLAFAPGAVDALLAHDWPGNVREL
ncbi:MAG TPA: sigma-54 dependent transcriptional regulator, partial [Planctomycetota bacterium]|nr:sigma-54 dependent transcriptional regulator [Planctomycetota bacterium]